MDSLCVHRYPIQTRIGCTEDERKTPQDILVDIEFFHPTKQVAKTDRLDEAIDYSEITEILNTIEAEERWTIEKLAEDIADALLKRWQPEGGVKVNIWKNPPINAESVSVTIHRP